MTDPTPAAKAIQRHRRPLVASLAVTLAALALPAPVSAQDPSGTGGAGSPAAGRQEATPRFAGGRLSLEQVISVAESLSEQVAVARAGVRRAEGERLRARADMFPQLLGSASYDRTLATEFSGIFGGAAGPPCDPFTPMPGAPLEERVAEIERAIDCGAVGGFFGGGGRTVDLPFGRENVYRFNLTLSQNIYTGGRISAQRDAASAGIDLARQELAAARASLVLDATQAYYDAALSEQLLEIAQAGLRQATSTLEQVELSYKAGRLPEFEVLRARVSRDNQRPLVVRTEAQRTLAYLRLRQLLHLPRAVPLDVEANLDDPVLPPPAPFPGPFPGEPAGRVVEPAERIAVRQAESAVSASEAALRVAAAQRLPSVSFNSAYGRVAYAGLPSFSDFRTNWTLGVFAQVPIFTGGRMKGDRVVAAAGLAQARAQSDRARNLAELDTQAAYEELQAALATWQASAGTVEQAARAYEIAQLRYREGISTQLELSDARYLLEQAQANRAQAARDLQVARARVVLLPDLPLGSGTSGSGVGTVGLSASSPGSQAVAGATPAAGTTGAAAASPAAGRSAGQQPGAGQTTGGIR